MLVESASSSGTFASSDTIYQAWLGSINCLTATNDDLRVVLSAPSSFSASVSSEEHLRMGKLADESGFADIAFAHYSSVIEDEGVEDSLRISAELKISELNKRYPLLGKKLDIETIKLVPESSIFTKIREFVILRIVWLMILPLIPLSIKFIF